MTNASPEPDNSADNAVNAAPGSCPSCGEPLPPDARFCEACGFDLEPVQLASVTAPRAETAAPLTWEGPACTSCGADPADITHDGWCGSCGQRQPDGRDHHTIDLGWVGAATDKGQRHHRNEDAMAIAVGSNDVLGDHAIAVVCDGVSSTVRPEEASQAAADAAVASLTDGVAALADGAAPGIAAAMHSAMAAAQESVVVASDPTVIGGGEPPSCTVVMALATDTEATVMWLGDSRAYWLPTEGTAEQITTDHSWANDQLEAGEMDTDAIAADPRSHSITRWLGIDAPAGDAPVVTIPLSGPGRLVLCSDGLWNYAPSPEELNTQVDRIAADAAEPVALATELAAWANESGGHDNITVVVIDPALIETVNIERSDSD